MEHNGKSYHPKAEKNGRKFGGWRIRWRATMSRAFPRSNPATFQPSSAVLVMMILAMRRDAIANNKPRRFIVALDLG